MTKTLPLLHKTYQTWFYLIVHKDNLSRNVSKMFLKGEGLLFCLCRSLVFWKSSKDTSGGPRTPVWMPLLFIFCNCVYLFHKQYFRILEVSSAQAGRVPLESEVRERWLMGHTPSLPEPPVSFKKFCPSLFPHGVQVPCSVITGQGWHHNRRCQSPWSPGNEHVESPVRQGVTPATAVQCGAWPFKNKKQYLNLFKNYICKLVCIESQHLKKSFQAVPVFKLYILKKWTLKK